MESKNNLNLKDGRKLNALIIGGSGASGRELIDHILENQNYESITILSRRKISRWENLSENQLKKFIFIPIENLDEILDLENNPEDYKKIIPEKKYDTLFCCLGSRSGRPDFKKVDLDYVIATAKITEMLKIYHFSLVSTKAADFNSWFKYLKIKGQAEVEVMKMKIPCISVLRPGAILNRDNDNRFGETVMKFTPFLSKIESKDLGSGMMNIDLNIHFYEKNQINIFENDEILKYKI